MRYTNSSKICGFSVRVPQRNWKYLSLSNGLLNLDIWCTFTVFDKDSSLPGVGLRGLNVADYIRTLVKNRRIEQKLREKSFYCFHFGIWLFLSLGIEIYVFWRAFWYEFRTYSVWISLGLMALNFRYFTILLYICILFTPLINAVSAVGYPLKQGWRQEFPDEGARFPDAEAKWPSVEGASSLWGPGGMHPRKILKFKIPVRRFAAFWQKILQNSEAYKIHKKCRNCLHNKPREKAHILHGPVVQKPVSLN